MVALTLHPRQLFFSPYGNKFLIPFNKVLMLSFNSILAASLLLLVGSWALPSVNAGKITILDDDGDSADIEAIALAVCEKLTGTGKQIAYISTIHKLADYLRGAARPDHELHSCSLKYLSSLVDLVEVLDLANDNVCGELKLRLIENFHQKYVSKVKKHVESQKRHSKVPKVVKLFFMQYASEVSSRCEQAAVEMVVKREHKISEQELESMNKIKAFTDALGMSDLSRGYDGIYLLWNMVDNLLLGEENSSLYFEKRESSARLNVQLSDPRSIVMLQNLCRSKIQPIYSQSILPVLRLTDLGYYPQGKNRLARDFQDPESAAYGLLMATQVCETILPIRLYQDEQLKAGKIIVLTKYEAALLKPLEVSKEVQGEASTLPVEAETMEVSMVEIDRLPSVHVGRARERVEMIKSAVESRSYIMMRMFRIAFRAMKSKIKSSLGKYLLSRKSQRNLMDEVELDKINLDQEANENSMKRKKRIYHDDDESEELGVWGVTKSIAKNIALAIAQLILWVFQLILMLAGIIVVCLYALTVGVYDYITKPVS